ncbi:putative F-box domain-containing protein [Medicago truncatula]|uniref:F-box protein interaction domain protein n=1 Tax=Medicago truncatula TaxID=3880 RepID=G7ZWA9_MEDTR|nr:F-box/kelch-repeat protein At3g23880 [Medicago truncatula]KEH37782.1 F-box protein interaction domain protein [Medicago truncatula]RHN73859.1 putative F-box domain-containing protein [Medicago truncatula]
MGICPSKFRHEINSPSPVILPDDLIAEVLAFLDVKSLTQLKCVSKSWYSLISDPFFVKLHLDKSSQKPHLAVFSAQFLTQHGQLTAFSLHRLLENQSTDVSIDDYTNYRMTMDNEYYRMVGCCNGLFCLLRYSKTEGYEEFSLRFWNPAMRSLTDELSSISISCNDNNDFRFSFGYDNLTNKYKVVSFRPSDVRVFTLGENNVWRNFQSFPMIPYLSISLNVGVYVSNSLVWLALRNKVYYAYDQWENLKTTIDQFVIISLDLGTETYTQMLPPRDFDEVPLFMPIVSVLMNCLCFSHCSKENNFVIWQMREFRVEASWTKLFKFNYQNIYPVNGHSDYRHLLPLHFFGDSLILASNGRQVVLYNRRENKVEARNTNAYYWCFAKHYVESLVSTF